MNSNTKIVTVVRAVFRLENQYLVVEQINASGNTYLLFPGGHADPGESLVTAIKREVAEELNVEKCIPKKIIFVKETLTPFDRTFEYFFECEPSMYITDIRVKQKEYTGYEGIKRCLWKSAIDLETDNKFFPKHFFSKDNYQYLELNIDQYKDLYGNDRNIKALYI
ncbi:MAG: NUDIX hydrolase [Candidatus Shapirobacteria bacterium]|jgi:ADP-ribose pyrophosphatase YjhB (NUDIX family)